MLEKKKHQDNPPASTVLQLVTVIQESEILEEKWRRNVYFVPVTKTFFWKISSPRKIFSLFGKTYAIIWKVVVFYKVATDRSSTPSSLLTLPAFNQI